MFGPNLADKYPLTAIKKLDLGCNSRPCCPGYFLIANPSFRGMTSFTVLVVRYILLVGWMDGWMIGLKKLDQAKPSECGIINLRRERCPEFFMK